MRAGIRPCRKWTQVLPSAGRSRNEEGAARLDCGGGELQDLPRTGAELQGPTSCKHSGFSNPLPEMLHAALGHAAWQGRALLRAEEWYRGSSWMDVAGFLWNRLFCLS